MINGGGILVGLANNMTKFFVFRLLFSGGLKPRDI